MWGLGRIIISPHIEIDDYIRRKLIMLRCVFLACACSIDRVISSLWLVTRRFTQKEDGVARHRIQLLHMTLQDGIS